MLLHQERPGLFSLSKRSPWVVSHVIAARLHRQFLAVNVSRGRRTRVSFRHSFARRRHLRGYAVGAANGIAVVTNHQFLQRHPCVRMTDSTQQVTKRDRDPFDMEAGVP